LNFFYGMSQRERLQRLTLVQRFQQAQQLERTR
jgi:hypothetical protein